MTKRKKKYSRKAKIMRRRRITTISIVTILCIIGVSCLLSKSVDELLEVKPSGLEASSIRTFDIDTIVTFDGHYQQTFNDIQEVQIVAAELNGVIPLSTPDSIHYYVEDGTLVEVMESALYEIEEVSHPYLTPDAKALLDTIASRYHQRDKIGQQLRVTSCLRTDASIAKLMRRNRNSVKNSCHLYGTTFDISYRKLTTPEKAVLAQILYELQQSGHCYVKYEYKQPCFHITIR